MEFNNTMPIYIQVIRSIKKDMIHGRLNLGDKLPSARDLAIQYQINPNTVNRIYRELEQMELCFTKRGIGTYVTEDESKLSMIRKEMADQAMTGFFKEMKELGFTKEELMNVVDENYDRE